MNLNNLLEHYPPQTVQAGVRQLSYRSSGHTAGDHEGGKDATQTTTKAAYERTLILLHGIGTDSASWVQQLEAFSPACRVVAWDAPGYGTSSPLAGNSPTAAHYAEALLALFDALHISKALLLGQSLGALMATAFAARHPERIETLVLTGPASGYGNATPVERAERLDKRVKQMNEQGPHGIAAARGASMLSEAASEDVRDFLGACQARLNPAGYIQAAHMLCGGVIAEDATRYRAPVLVLSGAGDKLTPEAGCRAVAQAFPCGFYRSLPGLGHGGYVENAALVNGILAAYLRLTLPQP